MASLWEWSEASHRYRNTSTGRFIGQAAMVGMRDQFIERQKQQMDSLGTRLADGRINTNQWLAESRDVIKQSFINEYVLAHGGRNSMTPGDWGRVGAMVKKQYGFLQGFAEDVQKGMSEAAIKNRAGMYVEAATQAFERGKAEAEGLPRLPQYPASGATRCLSRCKCSLNYVKVPGGWEVTWQLGVAEHCEDCLRLAQEWNPLVIMDERALFFGGELVAVPGLAEDAIVEEDIPEIDLAFVNSIEGLEALSAIDRMQVATALNDLAARSAESGFPSGGIRLEGVGSPRSAQASTYWPPQLGDYIEIYADTRGLRQNIMNWENAGMPGDVPPHVMALDAPGRDLWHVIMHEYGHHYHNRWGGWGPDSLSELSREFPSWKKDFGISRRAEDDLREAVAENFAAYMMGRKDLVHPFLREHFERHVK